MSRAVSQREVQGEGGLHKKYMKPKRGKVAAIVELLEYDLLQNPNIFLVYPRFNLCRIPYIPHIPST